MQVIPVMDLRGGLAVHAIAGERDRYAPLRHDDVVEGDPRSLIAFYAARNPPAIYVADLDAISGNEPQLDLWTQIALLAKCPLWIDCGIRDHHSCGPFLELQRRTKADNALILPTESLRSVSEVRQIADYINALQLILSLDRKDGKSLSSTAEVNEFRLLREGHSVGINKAIALDLASVGMGSAAKRLEQWAPCLVKFPDYQWILGGGVGCAEDLQIAKKHGFHGVLSATAILQGIL